MSKNWSTATRYFMLALVLIFVTWLTFAARALLAPLALAAFLAYLVNPLVGFSNRRMRLSRHWVVILVYLLSLAVIVALVAVLAPIVSAQVVGVGDELRLIVAELQRAINRPVAVLGIAIPVNQLLNQLPTADFVRADVILGLIQTTTTNLVWLGVVLVVTYYLLQDWPRLRDWIINLAPDSYRHDTQQLYAQLSAVWNIYLRGQLRLMFIVGFVTFVASALVGLPGALFFGVLAGLFDIVLTIGPAIVTIIAGAGAYFSGSTFLPISNFWFMVLVVAIYTVIQGVENFWLRPRIMGNALRMHPAVVFLGIVGALSLAGILTALIIVPLIASIYIVGHYFYSKFWGIDPWQRPGLAVSVTTVSDDHMKETGREAEDEQSVPALPAAEDLEEQTAVGAAEHH